MTLENLSAPQNEISVLIGLINDSEFLNSNISKLNKECFSVDAYRDIFTIIQYLQNEGKNISIPNIEFESKRNPDVNVESDDIAGLLGNAYYDTDCITLLIDFKSRREFYTKSLEFANEAIDPKNDIVDLIESSTIEMSDLVNVHIKKEHTSIKEVTEENIQLLANRKEQDSEIIGIPSGFAELDKYTKGFQNKRLYVFGGRPAMGKSVLFKCIARNIAVDYNIPVALFLLEMFNEEIGINLISSELDIYLDELQTGHMSDVDLERIRTNQETYQGQNTFAKAKNAPLYLDDTSELSTSELRSKTLRMIKKLGVKIILVDYLQIMKAVGKGNSVEKLASISTALKQIAKTLNIPVLALVQLTRDSAKGESGSRPKMTDIAGADQIARDADFVGLLHRDEYYGINVDNEGNNTKGIADIIIDKNRGGERGTIKLKSELHFARFSNLTEDNVTSFDESAYIKGSVFQNQPNDFDTVVQSNEEEIPF